MNIGRSGIPQAAMQRTSRYWRAFILAALAFGGGCAGHRVPAIDPSGERIFSGAATTIISPLAECPLWHRSPPVAVPAAVAPPVVAVPALPGACPPPLAAVAQPIPQPPPPICVKPPPAPTLPPSLTNPPCDQPSGPLIKVTPHDIVAPVCSEVVIAAGLCDPSGYFITGQPLEWMIPEGSIGEIVQVGRETRTGFTSFLRHSPQKIGTNYVRAYTSSIAQTIDRGTPSPLDDVSLAKGQSWISVTSPTEGTTFVTVWAPKEKDWERRRTTARVHWVDAKWTFPPPQISRFGQPVRLSTRIFRANGAPVPGWRVRYDVVGGPEASFGAGGQKSVEAPTLGDGAATVELVPNTTTAGITQVRIQIVRPGAGRGAGDMIVGQGLTSVTWSSPGLQVSATGPETSPIDGTLSYRVEVINNGDMVARDAKLSFTPPQSVSFVSSTPPASPLGQTLVWRLGDLQPRTATSVQVNCRATMAADVRARFRAETADNLAAEASVSTRVFASALSIRMTGPESVDVGQRAQFRVELTNTSRTAMTNVRVRDTFDPGLSEVNNKRSPIEIPFDQLAPGETKRFAVTFNVNEPGEQCHRIDVAADGGHTASARGCVTGIPSRAAPGSSPPLASSPISLEIKTSGRIEVGKRGIVQVDIVHAGRTPVTNLQLRVEHPPALNPVQASSGAGVEDNAVVWQIETIGPGERISRQVEFEGLEPQALASVRAAIVSDQTAEQSRQATIRVIAPAVTPPGTKAPPAAGKAGPMGAATPPTANANNLKVSAADNPDPVKVGGEVTYLIEVTNAGERLDSDVVLSFALPPSLTYKSLGSTNGRFQLHSVGGAGSGRFELTPIASLPAGGKSGTITLKATAMRAGKASLKLTVQSALNPQGLEFAAETTVLP